MTPSRRYGYQRGIGLSRHPDCRFVSKCWVRLGGALRLTNRSPIAAGEQAVPLTHQLGGGRADAVLDEVDDLGDDGGVAQDAAMAEAFGWVEAGLAPDVDEALGVDEGNLAVAAVVDDEERGVALADQLIERESRGGYAVVLGELDLEGGAIVVVECNRAREPGDRVVDQDVGSEHDVARGFDRAALVREQDCRGAERMSDDGVQRADRARDADDAVGEIGEQEAMAGGIAVPGGIERPDREAGADQRIDECAELRAAALPAVDEEDGGPVAPAPCGDAMELAAPARGMQGDVDVEGPSGRQDRALAVGPGVGPGGSKQSFGQADAEILGEDEGGLQRGLGQTYCRLCTNGRSIIE